MEIPSFRYSFNREDARNVASKIEELLSSHSFLTMGDHCIELENNFAKFNGSENVLAVNSGTAALELILSAYDLSGTTIAMPSNTFTATAASIIKAGAKVTYIDCDKDMNISLSDLRKKYEPSWSAIVIVHIGGFISPDIDEIKSFCEEKNLKLFEDAAHALGSSFNGAKAGNFGDAAAFSLFSTKVMTAGEGGLVTCKDQRLLEKMRIIHNHGQAQDNVVPIQGYNWRLPEMSAILAKEQLKRVVDFISQRRKAASIYDNAFLKSDFVERLQYCEEENSNYYKYILLPKFPLNLEDFTSYLKNEYSIALAGRVYPIPCHLQEGYAQNISLPMTEELCEKHFCLPIFSDMKIDETNYVIDSVNKSLNYFYEKSLS